jgi:ATP-dependent RNA helicase RhlE
VVAEHGADLHDRASCPVRPPFVLPERPAVHAFSELPLLPTLQSALIEQGLTKPTEIQRRAVPALLDGRSIVGVAQTGSGKTLAYALPILHILKTLETEGKSVEMSARPRAVVIVPGRELGEQVAKVFKPFTHTTRLRVRSVLGGTDIDVAKKAIAGPFDVLVATPGRVIKLLDRGLLRFDDVRFLVFDEADQMLDQGFLPDASKIADACMGNQQMAMFSATVSNTVQQLMAKLFDTAEVIRSEGSHRVPATLTTVNRTVVNGERLPQLQLLLSEHVTGGSIVFANTREQVDAVVTLITQAGRRCAVYRGEMDKQERRANLQAFRDNTVDILVSTDLAARGLDVSHVARVINFHMPKDLDNYLHRVGRTARAGRKGVVVNLITERDLPLLEQIEALQPEASAAAAARVPLKAPNSTVVKPKPGRDTPRLSSRDPQPAKKPAAPAGKPAPKSAPAKPAAAKPAPSKPADTSTNKAPWRR